MHINARLPFLSTGLFRLRNILLVVMLTVVALPLGAVYFFRIYENELVRQTELELISQSAVFSASFRQGMRLLYPEQADDYGYLLHNSTTLLSKDTLVKGTLDGRSLTPIQPRLDLTDPIAPPRPEPIALHQFPVDDIGRQLGRYMMPIMRETQLVTLSGIRILDRNGTVIAGRNEVGTSFAHIPEVRQALRGEFASVIRQRISEEPPPSLYSISRGANIRVFTAFPILQGRRIQGVVYLSRTPNNIVKHLYEVRRVLITASLSLLVVVLLLVLFVSSSISRPIRELIDQTQRMALGEQRVMEPLKYPVTYELAQLSNSFASMSRTLAERSEYINQFASHVSHEFKTPLTSMQGALELLQEHIDDMEQEQRQRFLDNLLADTQRMRSLMSRLLELARADALSPVRQKQTHLLSLLQSMSHRFAERGLQLRFTKEVTDEYLLIAPDVMEAIFNNLFENSLQHDANDVFITLQSEGGQCTIDVADNGCGISPANRSKIFTPFFTTRRSTGGTGLGLEIIQSLLRAYQGDLVLLPPSDFQGTAFRLSLSLS